MKGSTHQEAITSINTYGTPCFTVLHRCVFLQIEARPSTNKEMTTCCTVPRICAEAWHRTHNTSEVCLDAHNRAPKHRRQNPTEMKEGLDNSTVTVGDVNTSLSRMVRTTELKTNQEKEDFNTLCTIQT